MFAEHEFEFARTREDGASERDHRESGAAQWAKLKPKGKSIQAGEPAPVCPPELDYVWDWFSEIRMGLAGNGFAPAVITWEGLRSWAALKRIALAPWEASLLVTLGQLRASIELKKTNPSGYGKG